MTIENNGEYEASTFTSIEIHRKTQLDLNSGLLLMHTVQHATKPITFYVHLQTF